MSIQSKPPDMVTTKEKADHLRATIKDLQTQAYKLDTERMMNGWELDHPFRAGESMTFQERLAVFDAAIDRVWQELIRLGEAPQSNGVVSIPSDSPIGRALLVDRPTNPIQ